MATSAENDPKLIKLLQKIAAEQGIQEPEILVTPISSGGANYSSKLYLANVTGKDGSTLKLFLKIACISENMRQHFGHNIFETEQFIYTNLMKVYRQLEEKYRVPEEHKLLLPKYYGADMTHLQETLVLEDLGSRGFTTYSRFKSVDWQYASSAITELAKLHALSIVYQHENPAEYDKLVKDLKCGTFPESEDTMVFFRKTAQSALSVVHEKYKIKLKKFLDSITLSSICHQNRTEKRPVLIHTDFRPSNMLYRVKKNGSVEVIPVDYQSIQSGSPVMDLVYFIFTATDGPFRAQYYQALVDHYYSELGAALSRFQLKVEEEYPREDYEFELKDKLPNGLRLSIIGLPILTVSAENAPSLEGDDGMSGMAVQNTGDLYPLRLNEVVDDYVAWGILTD